MAKRKTTSEFIQQARAIHGDLYDYSKVEYAGDYLLKSGNTELFFKDVLGLDI